MAFAKPASSGSRSIGMNRCLLILCSFLLVLNLSGQGLDRFTGKQRLLLLFTPDLTHETFESQLLLLENHEKELAERLVLPLRLTPDGAYQASGTLIDDARAEWYYQYFGVDPRLFTVILVGLDGTEKFRSEGLPVTANELFYLIDRMPMRQAELRRRGGIDKR